ncbi:MAG: glycoside hydrolase family 3 protein [Lachnospiraceae bacterium]|nr:glycoside hydrolase family 3 protein [Lachnospiraceae bacterium]
MSRILDWKQYENKARQAVAEGAVLLRNENNVLPLKQDCKVALWGRMQNNYYKSGTGSGGLVNVDHVVDIPEGLELSGKVSLNAKLRAFYEEWEKSHPIVESVGWGQDLWSQEEAEVSDDFVKEIATESDVAVVVIARTAGEDRDNQNMQGAYCLTDIEIDLLTKVRNAFEQVVVILNVGNIMDFSFVEVANPDAVLLAWQGGIMGGHGIADVLTGKVSPSGRLSDTVAERIEDYPSHDNFGVGLQDVYCEDIYVGYRYFETFAQEQVKYPFGFGLSYTEFELTDITTDYTTEEVYVSATVTNTGKAAGKEVVQLYVSPVQGKLGRPMRELVGFAKTGVLEPGASEQVEIMVPYHSLATFDDSGVTGYPFCEVLEAGEYVFYLGQNVRDCVKAGVLEVEETEVVKQCEDILLPVQAFDRIRPVVNGNVVSAEKEAVPLATKTMKERRLAHLPKALEIIGDKGYSLEDVADGKITIEEFTAQLDAETLACLCRGEGMGSPRVTPGTAAAFAGISDKLCDYKVPSVCCSDGPSGMRLDCGRKAFSLPNGTLLACTFNEELNEELFALLGREMISNEVDVLLGPGMNIHRHPLNGRNFEYFSEDPLVTGKMAAAQLRGLHASGVTGAIKHFCANNREYLRREMDSVVSARALREIYLKAFKIAIDEGGADTIMTTYGALNGVWTAGHYDLVTALLRDEWGFEGFVMTDWWTMINEEGKLPDLNDFASMVRAQNDVYMVCPDASVNSSGDNLMAELKTGELTLGELQRCAVNVLKFSMKTAAFARLRGTLDTVEVIGGPKQEIEDFDSVEYYALGEEYEVDLSGIDSSKGQNFVFAVDVEAGTEYEVEYCAKSDLGELAQLPVTLFYQGFPIQTFAFQGSGGKPTSVKRKMQFRHRYAVYRLYFPQNGLQMLSMKFKLIGKMGENTEEFLT